MVRQFESSMIQFRLSCGATVAVGGLLVFGIKRNGIFWL